MQIMTWSILEFDSQPTTQGPAEECAQTVHTAAEVPKCPNCLEIQN